MATVGREDIQAKVTANGKVQATKKVDISATIPGQITHAGGQGRRPGGEGPAPAPDRLRQPARHRPQHRVLDAGAAADQQSAQRQPRRRPAPTCAARRRTSRPASSPRRRSSARARPSPPREAAASAAARRVRAGAGHARGRPRHAGQDHRSARPWTGSSPPSASRKARSRSSASRTAPAPCSSPSPTCRWSRPSWRSTRPSIPSVKLGQEARIRIDAYPNQTFKGVVTEVGGSPILPAAGAGQQRDQVPGQGADQGPARRTSSRGSPSRPTSSPASARRRWWCRSRPWSIRDREGKPGDAATGTPRDEEGVFLMEDGKAKFQPIKTGLLGELSLEVTDGLKGGETLITGPFKSLRTLKPGDAVKKEEKKKERRRPGRRPGADADDDARRSAPRGRAGDARQPAAQLPHPARHHHRRGHAGRRRLRHLRARTAGCRRRSSSSRPTSTWSRSSGSSAAARSSSTR